jgi:hypothetical protein
MIARMARVIRLDRSVYPKVVKLRPDQGFGAFDAGGGGGFVCHVLSAPRNPFPLLGDASTHNPAGQTNTDYQVGVGA